MKTKTAKPKLLLKTIMNDFVIDLDLSDDLLKALIECEDFSSFKNLLDSKLSEETTKQNISILYKEIKESKVKNVCSELKSYLDKTLDNVKPETKIDASQFEDYYNKDALELASLSDLANNIENLIKERPEMDTTLVTVLLHYKKICKGIENIMVSFKKSLKALVVDPFLGKDKKAEMINLLKMIKVSKPKSGKEDTDIIEDISIDGIELDMDYKEFFKLVSNAKFNDCKGSVKELGFLLKHLNPTDISEIISILEKSIFSDLYELSDKEFISPNTLKSAISSTDNEYLDDIKHILLTIKNTLNDTHNKHLVSILTFIKDKIISVIISDMKEIIKEYKERDTLTILNYMDEFKSDPCVYSKVIDSTDKIIDMLPCELKCKLIIPSELALVGIKDEDILIKYVMSELILKSVLSPEFIVYNLSVYNELREYAETLTPDDSPEMKLESVVKDNLDKVIKHLQQNLIK